MKNSLSFLCLFINFYIIYGRSLNGKINENTTCLEQHDIKGSASKVTITSLTNTQNSELMAFMQMPEIKIQRDDITVNIEDTGIIQSENADIPAKFNGTGIKYSRSFQSFFYSDEITDQTNEGLKTNTTVTFIIEKDGSIADVKILQPVNKVIDRELVRVFKRLPKFYPAKHNGILIKCKVIVPIQFDIEGLPKKKELIVDPVIYK